MTAKTIHTIHFPRYTDDIASRHRTVFHVPCVGTWKIGDVLRLTQRGVSLSPALVGVLTDARLVRLLAEVDADLGKLGAAIDRATYLASWDEAYPELSSGSNPAVWRIEFRYGDSTDLPNPPEWSLAA